MSSIAEINRLIKDGASLKLISQSLSEVSALRLSRIKDRTEHNRHFFDEISAVYHMIKIIAAQKKIFITKNKQTISILLTSNYRFSGFTNQLIRFFIKNTAKFETQRVVIGKTANQSMSSIADNIPYQSLVFKDDLPSYDELKYLSDIVNHYQRVLIFFTKFESMLSQKPSVQDITASASQIEVPTKELSYIFEPEIRKVLTFFDTQITILLLEQTFLETELSRVAGRLITMSEAERKAELFIATKKVSLSTAKKSLNNTKLLETLISQIKFRERMGESV